jgi:phage shock protein A
VRTIQRADKAITTGKSVADNGKAALSALTALHVTDAGHLLGQAKDGAATLIAQTKQFDKSRKRCNADRK